MALTFGISCFSQEKYEKIGYCGKTPLKEIKAKYGEIHITTGSMVLAGDMIKKYVFEYGQDYKKDVEARVNDQNGDAIVFSTFAEVMNFFDYNGWEYVDLKFNPQGSHIILFRKK